MPPPASLVFERVWSSLVAALGSRRWVAINNRNAINLVEPERKFFEQTVLSLYRFKEIERKKLVCMFSILGLSRNNCTSSILLVAAWSKDGLDGKAALAKIALQVQLPPTRSQHFSVSVCNSFSKQPSYIFQKQIQFTRTQDPLIPIHTYNHHYHH